jgi:hypothetical protein
LEEVEQEELLQAVEQKELQELQVLFHQFLLLEEDQVEEELTLEVQV